MNSFIELDRIAKHYGDDVVLENLSCTISRGEFVTLVGASGCGKSTFLKILLGTESPTTGQVLMEGEPIGQEPSAERGVVWIPEAHARHLDAVAKLHARIR